MTAAIPDILQRNLFAIKRRDPTLAERICLPVSSDHVSVSDDGEPRYRLHRNWHPFVVPSANLEESVASAEAGKDIFLAGLGVGEQLNCLLAQDDHRSVVAWDQDPWLLRLTLSDTDFSEDINSGRLRFALCSDLVTEIEQGFADRSVVLHPFLAQVYRNEIRLLEHGLAERRALVCAGTLFVDDLADALREQGFAVATWPVAQLAPEELLRSVHTLQPELVASINYSHGLAEACQKAGLPLLVWEIDPSTDALRPTQAGTGTSIFTYRKAHIPLFEDAGFSQVGYLPLGTNPKRRKPVTMTEAEKEHYGSEVSFVGNSMFHQAERFRERFLDLYFTWKGSEDNSVLAEVEEHLAVILTTQSENFDAFEIPELVALRMPYFQEAMRNRDPEDDPVTLIAEMAAADRRGVYVGNLGQVGIKVWGDDGWKPTEAFGARFMGQAGHRDELTRIYGASLINVDIGRLYQPDIITMRVFDALACGGFVLAEHNQALEELFDIGAELDSYRSLAELLEKVEYYLANPDEARAIGQRGLQAVLRQHTIAHRVEHMLKIAELGRPASA